MLLYFASDLKERREAEGKVTRWPCTLKSGQTWGGRVLRSIWVTWLINELTDNCLLLDINSPLLNLHRVGRMWKGARNGDGVPWRAVGAPKHKEEAIRAAGTSVSLGAI